MSLDDVLARNRDRRHPGRKACALELRDNRFGRDADARRRPAIGTRAKVHDEEPSARPEGECEAAHVRYSFREVVPQMNDEDSIDAARGKARGGSRGQDRAQVGKLLTPGAFTEKADHVRFEVGREHFASRYSASESHGEVPSPSSDVGNDHRGFEFERAKHLVGALPSVTRRIVEHPRPSISIGEGMVVTADVMARGLMPVSVCSCALFGINMSYRSAHRAPLRASSELSSKLIIVAARTLADDAKMAA